MAHVSDYNYPIASLLTLLSHRSHSYYCFEPPRMLDIPTHSLPNAEANPAWYSDLLLRYPPDQHTYSIGLGHGMRALSDLRVIQNEIVVMSFSRYEAPKKMPWGAALHIQMKLEAWYEALPTQLQPESLVYPPHMILQ
jgi:hypothetical protein